MTTDQAQRLRELAAGAPGRIAPKEQPRDKDSNERLFEKSPRLAHATALVSGKGGVGKSNIALNLAVALSCWGRRVVLFDADMGMANLDVLCGLTPQATLEDVLRGRAALKDVLVTGPGGFRLVPGSSGVAAMANLDGLQRRRILGHLAAFDRVADHLVIDMGAGIGSGVTTFAVAAHRVLVVTTPEPTAMTDAYGAIKSLVARGTKARLELMVNMANSFEEGLGVHRRIERVVERFLGTKLHLGGVIPSDPALPRAVRLRQPVFLAEPHSQVAYAFGQLGRRLAGVQPDESPAAKTADSGAHGAPHGLPAREGFFQRIARAIRRRPD